MTTIDASKSELLPQLLRKLVIGLTQLSNADLELQQVVTKLNLLRGNLIELPVEEAANALDHSANLIQGYNLKEFKGNEFVVPLPEIIEVLKDELDHLALSAKAMGKTASELLFFTNLFNRLAQ